MIRAIITKERSGYLVAIEREIDRDPRLKSANTRRGYRHDLGKFEEWRNGRPMTKLLVEEYAAELQRQGKSPNTINRVLAAIRWMARKIEDLAYEDAGLGKRHREEIVLQASRVAKVKDVTGSRSQRGRHISQGELRALMGTCATDPSPAGVRDAAIIALAWATGARRSELASVQLEDYTPNGESEGDIIIKGKGDRIRKVYIYDGAADALNDWLIIRGDEPGPLFYAINKGGNVQKGHGVSGEALRQVLGKRAEQAGVKHLTWHDFRRTFAGNLLDNGVDLVTTQKLLGHSTPTTTSQYDRRGEEVKRRAVQSLHVPYARRAL